MEELNAIAKDARLKVLQLIFKAQTSHIGSNFSCIEIFVSLFNKIDLDKDVFVLSAGWKAATLYYFLYRAGRITEEQLNSYCQDGSEFIGLAEPIIPEIKIAGGSMGLGFPGAVGIAMAKKIKGEEGKVYVLMSDGELQCGTTWEAGLIAAHHKLDNLVLIVDNNGLQAMGRTKDIIDIPYLDELFSQMNWFTSFGFGHSFDFLLGALSTEPATQPHVIIANTIKGRGVSFMQDNNLYHYAQLTDDDYEKAYNELNG